MTDSPLVSENARLRAEIATKDVVIGQLTDEVRQLRERMTFLEARDPRAIGILGESLVIELVGGKLAPADQTYDVLAGNGCDRLEVKYASLEPATAGKPTMRWQWAKVLGHGGKKSYDRLILIGDTHDKHRAKYKDPASPYVLFDVPFDQVMSLTVDGGTAGRQIKLTSNPARVQVESAKRLFAEYEVTREELRRYRGSERDTDDAG